MTRTHIAIIATMLSTIPLACGNSDNKSGRDGKGGGNNAGAGGGTNKLGEVSSGGSGNGMSGSGGTGTGAGPAFSSDFCNAEGWCWHNPRPHGERLFATWASAPDDIWAAGDSKRMVHFDGTEWRYLELGMEVDVRGMWGSNAEDIWAASTNGMLHFDGREWTLDSDSPTYKFGVWGSGSSDVWAVGSDGIHHWDGSAWTPEAVAANSLRDVWGSGANDVWAGGRQSQLWHFDGAQWSQVSSPQTETRAIWGTSADDIWFVGNGIYHYDGENFSPVAHGFSLIPTDVRGTASNDIYITDQNGKIAHYNGEQWVVVYDNQQEGNHINALAIPDNASPGNDLWAVGLYGQTIGLDDGVWSKHGESVGGSFLSIVQRAAVIEDDNIWTMPYSGDDVHHYDGSSWSVDLDAPHHWAVWGTAANDIWTGTANGVVTHYDGASWTTTSSGISGIIRDMWGSSSTDVFAVSDQGISHYDGSVWTPVSVTLNGALRAVWGSASDDVWAAGDKGSLFHYDGSTWSLMNTNTTADLKAVSGSSKTDVWIGGVEIALHYDGVQLESIQPSQGSVGNIQAVASAGPDETYLFATSGNSRKWNGSDLVPADPLVGYLGSSISDAAVSPSGAIYAFTYQGHVTWKAP